MDGDIIFFGAERQEKWCAMHHGYALRLKVEPRSGPGGERLRSLWAGSALPCVEEDGEAAWSDMPPPFAAFERPGAGRTERASPRWAPAPSAYDMVINGCRSGWRLIVSQQRDAGPPCSKHLGSPRTSSLKFRLPAGCLKYGTAAASLAFGLVRLSMLLASADNIREDNRLAENRGGRLSRPAPRGVPARPSWTAGGAAPSG